MVTFVHIGIYFGLVSVILSIHRNVTNEVGLKLVDVVNHC